MRSILGILFRLGKSNWIIDEDGDVGFTFFNYVILTYKWSDSFIIEKSKNIKYRTIKKRELNLRRSYNNKE